MATLRVGTGLTFNGVTGDVNFTGIATAVSFAGNVTGNVTGTASTATLATNAQGLTGTPNITVGVSTITTIKVGTAATIDSSGINVTGVITTSQLSGGCLATIANMSGIHTLGVTTAASTFVTLRHPNQTSNISNGDFVVGTGITVGTTVSAGAGTSSLTLSLPVGINSNANRLAFYKHDKIVTPAIIGGQLCRAWVNFDGTGTVHIRSSYNVSSITDNGTGAYNINMTTALPDTNYCVHMNCWSANTAIFIMGSQTHVRTFTSSSFPVTVSNSTALGSDNGDGLADVVRIFVSVFR